MFFENALSKAEKCLLHNKNQKAVGYLLKAIAENPSNLHILSTLADVYVKIGNPALARERYLAVAREYERLGEVGKAIGAYRKIHNVVPDDFEVAMALARLYLFDRNYPQAEYFLKSCSEELLVRNRFGPREEDLSLKLIRMLQTISGVSPSSLETLRLQAQLYRKTGRDRLASELDLRIGLIYARDGKVAPALAMLQPLLSFFPGNLELLQTLTDLLAAQGRLAEGVRCLDECLVVSPSNVQILLLKAKLLTRFGEFDAAEELFHKALFADPSNYKELLDFAYRLVDAGHYDQATRQIDYIHGDLTFLQKMEIVTFCKTLLERDRQNVPALTKLAFFYGEMNDIIQLSSIYLTLFRTYVQQQVHERAHQVGKMLLEMGYRDSKFLADYEANKSQLHSHERVNGDEAAVDGVDGLVKVDTRKVRLWPYTRLQTQEVEARALPENKREVPDVLLNIELLLKYGARERALELIQQSLDQFGDNPSLREKLRNYRLGNSGAAHAAMESLRLSEMIRAHGRKRPSGDSVPAVPRTPGSATSPAPLPPDADVEAAQAMPGFTGDLQMFTLIDIIQLICASNKTGSLIVVSGDASGLVNFNSGRVVSAQFGHWIGEEAVYNLLRVSQGVFEFRPESIDFRETIRISTTNLLLEGLRRIDEGRRTQAEEDSEYDSGEFGMRL